MRIEFKASFAALCGLTLSNATLAQSQCDCTSIVGSCSAEVAVQDSFIEVTSNAAQCARVDYFVDGMPFVAVLVDGADSRPFNTPNDSPSVIVQSCQVCLNNPVSSAEPTFGAGLYTEGEATTLIEVAPIYPPAALAAGIEGFVEVRFTVSPSGTVSGPEIVASEPAGVFEDAALAALSRWRYTRNPDGEPLAVTERLEFNLSSQLFSLRPSAGETPRAAAAAPPRRNSCIQEETRYDFGAMVDVSLINACQQPLIVYSCSAGTGSLVRRWVCRDQEATSTVLASVSATGTDSVVGSAASDQFAAVTRFEITRAPNGEYWWLACEVEDTACRSDGRQWIRSLDRQTDSIDPQDRTRARLARSF